MKFHPEGNPGFSHTMGLQLIRFEGLEGWLKVDFCESKFTESRDREWDLSRKFLRVKNENESSGLKIESWEWEWEFWGEKWDWNWEWDSQFSRMGVWLRLKVHLFLLIILKCDYWSFKIVVGC